MKTRDRAKHKGRKSGGSFLALPHHVLHSSEYAALSPRAVKLLIDVGAQYSGQNNGALCASASILKAKRWTSNDQLSKAKSELITSGFIVCTRVGARTPKLASLYAITWQGIDECPGKNLDVSANPVPSNLWRKRNAVIVDVRHTVPSVENSTATRCQESNVIALPHRRAVP